jgi:hypothetical protein
LHLAALVDVLLRHDALLHTVGTDPTTYGLEAVSVHQAGQAAGITRYLTGEFLPTFVESVRELRRQLEAMPPQLYVQCVAMLELVWTVAEEAALYFAQRRPRELALFEWIIDAKDKQVTTQERWWRDVIGPLGESRSRREPFKRTRDPDFDYTHFDRAFRLEKDLWHPDKPRERIVGIDIKKMISDRVTFVDSRSELLIQAADVLAGFMRRVLRRNSMDHETVLTLGRLTIPVNHPAFTQSVRLVSLGSEKRVPRFLGPRLKAMASAGRPMLKPRPRFTRDEK